MKEEINVHGNVLDGQTRCTHYHNEQDIIAIKFACCGKFYPCYFCHQEQADHPVQRWPAEKFDEKAILCGKCKSVLSIRDYLFATDCPVCRAEFNQGCIHHYHLYFDFPDQGKNPGI